MNSSNPFQMLQNDHKTIQGLFRQVMVLKQRAHEMIPGLVEELFLELGIHRVIQQEIIIPALIDRLDGNNRGRLLHVDDQHGEIAQLIGELRRQSVDAEDYSSRMTDLRQLVELHFEEEERDIFPLVRQYLIDEAPRLVERIQARRDQILRHPRFRRSVASFVQKRPA